MTKFPMRIKLGKPMAAKPAPKPTPKPMPKPTPKPAPKLKATAAEAAAIDRGNRAQAREAQFVRTTVRERTTPPKKK
jgi:hypothetical protein